FGERQAGRQKGYRSEPGLLFVQAAHRSVSRRSLIRRPQELLRRSRADRRWSGGVVRQRSSTNPTRQRFLPCARAPVRWHAKPPVPLGLVDMRRALLRWPRSIVLYQVARTPDAPRGGTANL